MSKPEMRVHEGSNYLELSQNLHVTTEKKDILKTEIEN